MLSDVNLKGFNFLIYHGRFDSGKIREQIEEIKHTAEFLVCPFLTFSEIILDDELANKSESLKEFTKLTCDTGLKGFCGVNLIYCGVKQVSAVVTAGCELVDIASKTIDFDRAGVALGDKIKTYKTKNGVIGLLLDTDCLIEQYWQILKDSCDLVLIISKTPSELIKQDIRHSSGVYNLPYLYVDGSGIEYRD